MGLCITGKPSDVSDIVVLTQDATNVKMLAESILEKSYCFNEIRNMHGYTGWFRGRCVTVQGIGIGPVSAAMYAIELGLDFLPKSYWKVEGCKALDKRLKCGDIVLAQTAHTTSRINQMRFGGRTYPAAANFVLMNKAWELAHEQGRVVWAGPVLSVEHRQEMALTEKFAQHGTLALDMEMNQVYTAAARFALPALGILCVFEKVVTGEILAREERVERLKDLAQFALEVAVST